MEPMLRKFLFVVIFALFAQASTLNAGTTGSEELKNASSQNSAS